MPVICLACIVLILGSFLQKSTYYNSLTEYGSPICRVDRHRFEAETCESCGGDIRDFGVFYSVSIATMKLSDKEVQLPFSTYYNSYAEFSSDYTSCFALAIGVVVSLVLCIGSYVFMRVWFTRRKKV